MEFPTIVMIRFKVEVPALSPVALAYLTIGFDCFVISPINTGSKDKISFLMKIGIFQLMRSRRAGLSDNP